MASGHTKPYLHIALPKLLRKRLLYMVKKSLNKPLLSKLYWQVRGAGSIWRGTSMEPHGASSGSAPASLIRADTEAWRGPASRPSPYAFLRVFSGVIRRFLLTCWNAAVKIKQKRAMLNA
jgi:hypothetical protein